MSQLLFPVYPEDTFFINSNIGVKTIDEKQVVYFNSGGPIYQHKTKDLKSFRFITSQMMDLKMVKQIEVIKAFKVSTESTKRWLKKYRQNGAAAFFGKPVTRKGGTILTREVVQLIESYLREGKTVGEISNEMCIKQATISKAILQGRIIKPEKKT